MAETKTDTSSKGGNTTPVKSAKPRTSKKKTATKPAPKSDQMTAGEAAKLVKRQVPERKDGKPTGKMRQLAVKTEEVLSFREYESHVVVVTKDGQKLQGDKA